LFSVSVDAPLQLLAPGLTVVVDNRILLLAEVHVWVEREMLFVVDELQMSTKLVAWREHRDLKKITLHALKAAGNKESLPLVYVLVQVVASPIVMSLQFSYVRPLFVVEEGPGTVLLSRSCDVV
jgi:hypothetical protein